MKKLIIEPKEAWKRNVFQGDLPMILSKDKTAKHEVLHEVLGEVLHEVLHEVFKNPKA